MARHSQPAGRFDRQCATARSSCSPYLLAARWIRPGLKIQSLKLPRAKKLTVLHSMFSYCWSFLRASIRFSLCRTAADALRFNNRNVAHAAATKASGIFKATAAKPINRCNSKVTDLLPERCEPEAERFRNEI